MSSGLRLRFGLLDMGVNSLAKPRNDKRTDGSGCSFCFCLVPTFGHPFFFFLLLLGMFLFNVTSSALGSTTEEYIVVE